MEPLLELKGIDKAFRCESLIRCCPAGLSRRVMALVGENGAGKSTMMKVLTGIYKRCRSDSVSGAGASVYGAEIVSGSRYRDYSSGTEPDPELTIAENIFLGREFTGRFGNIDWKKCMPKRINYWPV